MTDGAQDDSGTPHTIDCPECGGTAEEPESLKGHWKCRNPDCGIWIDELPPWDPNAPEDGRRAQ